MTPSGVTLKFMGAKIQIRSHILKADSGKYTKAIQKRATTLWSNAIAAYIIAVASIVGRYQETSMSYASLFPTARKVKALGKMPFSISPKVEAKKTYIDMSGNAQKGQYKTQWRGLAAGAGDKCSRIEYGGPSGLRFYFRFDIRVFQYLMNELGEWKLGPFDSIEYGHEMMMNYLEKHGRKIFPPLNEFITKESVI